MAFDTVKHDILLAKLNHYGIGGLVNNWLSSTCVVLQGSTLGPLLFLVYINDLKGAFPKLIIHHFADDTNLYFLSKNLALLNLWLMMN